MVGTAIRRMTGGSAAFQGFSTAREYSTAQRTSSSSALPEHLETPRMAGVGGIPPLQVWLNEERTGSGHILDRHIQSDRRLFGTGTAPGQCEEARKSKESLDSHPSSSNRHIFGDPPHGSHFKSGIVPRRTLIFHKKEAGCLPDGPVPALLPTKARLLRPRSAPCAERSLATRAFRPRKPWPPAGTVPPL